MAERNLVYFVADAHLGLRSGDPAAREERFLQFLKGIPRDTTAALWLLGDIWDFWYEYRDVIPREGIRVVAQLIDLMDSGVEVCYVPGNHDIWCYNFFESIGIRKVSQPVFETIGGKRFCLGHGDLLGGARWSYKFMLGIFRCRFLQRCFSALHPWIAYRFGLGWSHSNRRTHEPYIFKGEEEPLYKYAQSVLDEKEVDFFVFGHYHVGVDMQLPGGQRLVVVKDWLDGGSPYACFDGERLVTSF